MAGGEGKACFPSIGWLNFRVAVERPRLADKILHQKYRAKAKGGAAHQGKACAIRSRVALEIVCRGGGKGQAYTQPGGRLRYPPGHRIQTPVPVQMNLLQNAEFRILTKQLPACEDREQ